MTAYADVKDSHLTFNGKKYFRGGSEDVEFASYGEKKTPVLKTNYLEVQDRLPAPKLKVKEAVIVEIDFDKTNEKDFLANINVAGVFKGSANTAYSDMKSGKLKLLKLRMDNEDVKDAANSSPKALDNLISYGNDARIAHQVFVVVDAQTAKSFAAGSSFDVSLKAGLITVSLNGSASSNGTTSVSVSAGSVFAYGLVKLVWDATQKKNKTKITKVTDDQWGTS